MYVNNNSLEVLLTVFCSSYNFEEYLEDAFNGFLNQITDFKFKVFVFDDASTDNSQAIIERYLDKYPELFCAYLAKENTYGKPERLELLYKLYDKYFEGRYVAVCEGDDYWIDSHKLQKQVDYMEVHPECSMTVHASHWIDCVTGKEYDFHPYKETRYLTEEEVIIQPGGNPSTASQVFRMKDLKKDKVFEGLSIGDYTRQLYEITKGRIYYFNDVMSTYRSCHFGSWTEKYKNDKKYNFEHRFEMFNFLEKYDEYTKCKYHRCIEKEQDSYMYDTYLMNPSISLDEYFLKLNELEIVSEKNKNIYKYGRYRIGDIVRGKYRFTEKEKRELKRANAVLIYGCGEYSVYIRNVLEKSGIVLSGYVISDDQDEHEAIKDVKVWRLSELPYKIEDVFFIVGTGAVFGAEIRNNLKKIGAKNIYEPFSIRNKSKHIISNY